MKKFKKMLALSVALMMIVSMFNVNGLTAFANTGDITINKMDLKFEENKNKIEILVEEALEELTQVTGANGFVVTQGQTDTDIPVSNLAVKSNKIILTLEPEEEIETDKLSVQYTKPNSDAKLKFATSDIPVNNFSAVKEFDKSAIEAILIKNPPKKMDYLEGEEVSFSGLVVTVIDTNGLKKDVAYAQFSDLELKTDPKAGYKIHKDSDTENVSVIWKDRAKSQDVASNQTAPFGVTKYDPQKLKTISILNQPTKRTYTEGENLNLNGLKLQLVDTAGATRESNYDFIGQDGVMATPAHGSVLNASHHGEPILLSKMHSGATAKSVNTAMLTVNPPTGKINVKVKTESENIPSTTFKVTLKKGGQVISSAQAKEVMLTSTEKTKSVSFSDLAYGSDYTVEVTNKNNVAGWEITPHTETITLDGASVEKEITAKYTKPVENGKVKVVINAVGVGKEEETFSVQLKKDGVNQGQVQTVVIEVGSDQGEKTFTNLPYGKYTVEVTATKNAARWKIFILDSDGIDVNTNEEVVLRANATYSEPVPVENGKVKVVINATGERKEKETFSVQLKKDGVNQGQAQTVVIEAGSDQGEKTITNLPYGQYTVEVTATENAARWQVAAIDANGKAVNSDAEVELTVSATYSKPAPVENGKVKVIINATGEGKAKETFSVQLKKDGVNQGQKENVVIEAETAKGEKTFTNLPYGKYTVEVTATENAARWQVAATDANGKAVNSDAEVELTVSATYSKPQPPAKDSTGRSGGGSAQSSVRPGPAKTETGKAQANKSVEQKEGNKAENQKDKQKTETQPQIKENSKVSTKLSIGEKNYTVVIDGQKVEKTMDVSPRVHQGRTVLPARMISEILGVDVKYEAQTKTASFMYGEQNKVELQLGQKYMTVNGQKVALTADILNVNGRILLPLTDIQKAFAELGLTANVSWDAQTKSVQIEK